MKDLFRGALDAMFGFEGEEEEEADEEDNINLEALEESEIKEIGNEVLKNLAKCSTAQEVKDYCTLICHPSLMTHLNHGWLIIHLFLPALIVLMGLVKRMNYEM